MDEIELDERQAGFIQGWFAGRGITRPPTLAQFSEALQAVIDAGLMPEPAEGEEYTPSDCSDRERV